MQQILSQNEFDEIVGSSQLINDYIDIDPHTLALKGVGATICTQIKYLQRAAKKLPTYYKNCCIIPSLSFEQSSSEATASVKDFGDGKLAIDLTCGLGVDTLYISQKFKQVISIERDEILAKVALKNFEKLGCNNITVINDSALSYLSSIDCDTKIDLIYIDPARRDNTKKVFLLEDCSPNMVHIMPLAVRLANRIMIKLSPLFDVDAAYDYFSQWGVCSTETVSYKGECKELLVTVEPNSKEESTNSVNIATEISKSRRYIFSRNKTEIESNSSTDYKYLYIPDVSLYKSRTTKLLMSEIYNCKDFYQPTQNAPIFSNTLIEDFEGSSYQIETVHPYKPKELRKLLKVHNNRAKVLIKEFKFTTSQIKKELHINDGESPITLFSSTNVYFLTLIK